MYTVIFSFWPRDSQADGCELVTCIQLQQEWNGTWNTTDTLPCHFTYTAGLSTSSTTYFTGQQTTKNLHTPNEIEIYDRWDFWFPQWYCRRLLVFSVSTDEHLPALLEVICLHNIGNYTSNNTALHLRRHKFSVTANNTYWSKNHNQVNNVC